MQEIRDVKKVNDVQVNDVVDVGLTLSAQEYVKNALVKRPELIGIRLGVKKAGCSGLSYILDFAKEIKENDKIFEMNGVKIIVDESSYPFLKGTTLDWVKEGLNEFPKFYNPNVKGACGCGESFTIEEKSE